LAEDNEAKLNSKIHTTFDVIDWLKVAVNQNVVMITTHPQRWTNNSIEWYVELLKQRVKNSLKTFIVRTKTDY